MRTVPPEIQAGCRPSWLLHGDRQRALSSLVTARAPQQTRYLPMVHETVRVLALKDGADTVQGFAAWCGIS